MEDADIIDLYYERSQSAIAETKSKYGRMLMSISFGIVKNTLDAEECENDTYLKTWNAIPPERPNIFSAFLSRIIRNLSLNRYEELHAQKRNMTDIPVLLDELSECIPARNNVDDYMNEQILKQSLNMFLKSLKKDDRIIFMRRYWFCDSIEEISKKFGYGTSKIKMSLLRSRKKLKMKLKDEELWYE